MKHSPRPSDFRRSAIALAVSSLYLLPALAGSPSAPGPIAGEFQVNTATALNQNNPAIAVDADGDFVVVWQHDFSATDQNIRGQRYSANGRPAGAEFLIAGVGGDTDETNPSVAMDASGNFVVAWVTNTEGGVTGNFGIQARRYNAAGVAQGSVFSVNTVAVNTQFLPSVALDADGDFVVAWQSRVGGSYEIIARRFNAAGVAQGAEFQVNTTIGNDQIQPVVAIDADGDFVVSWSSNISGSYEIIARRYNAAAVAQDGEFQVNTTIANNQFNPTVALDADGDFVVAWNSFVGGSYEIFARPYNAAGVAQGGEFQVNTTIANNQFNPTIALDADGDFAVAWESYVSSSSSSSDEIIAQRYNAAGVAQGGEFQVNTTITNNQFSPTIALDSDGDLVVAWQSFIGSSLEIIARRYQGPDSVDISLFQTDSADPAPVGSPINYTLSVGNLQAPSALTGIAVIDDAIGSATGLRVVDTVPSGGTVEQASGTSWTCASSGTRVTCDYGRTLLAGEQAEPLVVSLTPPNSPGTTSSNVGRASANQFDDNLLNNREVESTQLVCPESVIELSASSYSVGEAGGSITITANRTGSSCARPASVQFDTAGSSALPGLDFTDVTGTLSWDQGDLASKTFSIPIINDALDEIDERVLINLSSPQGASLGSRNAARLSIVDDDASPRLNFTTSSQTVTEAAGLLTVTMQLSSLSGRDVSVAINRTGSASLNSDYFQDETSFTIPAGTRSVSFDVELIDDAITEPTETLSLAFGSITGATPGAFSSHSITITDNDTVAAGPTVSFDIANASASEATANTVTVVLSAASTQTVTVPYTRSGSATFTTDYALGRSSPVTFNPGQTTRTIVITPVDDTIDETDETAILTLGTPTNATLGTTTVHTRTIVDNDP